MEENRVDRWLFLAVLLLICWGIVMVYSTSAIFAEQKFGDSAFFIKRHLIFAAFGLLVMLLAIRLPYRWLTKAVYILVIINVAALALTYIPGIGVKVGGARRWINLGLFNFQPAEMMKLTMVIYLSYLLAEKFQADDYDTSSKSVLVPPILIIGLSFLLILKQPDLGTVVILAALVGILLFVSGFNLIYLLGAILLAIPVFYFQVMNVAYRRNRILSFLNPWDDPSNKGFQIIQSFVAFNSGGITGVGLGAGKQKLFFLPEAHTDFILAVIAEEIGFVGVILILGVFSFIIIKGLRIAARQKDLFASYLAVGLTSVIGLQVILNAGVVSGLLPTKGMTMPFLSYGGTSLVLCCLATGLLLNLSKFVTDEGVMELEKPKPKAKRKKKVKKIKSKK
jgi:cell division protein FtsW